MSTPHVSVIIPAYNRAKTISRAIHSVQQQSIPDWELLVVDDASTDDTPGVVDRVPDARIRLLRQTTNSGPSGARQTGVEAARGEFVAFLDSDDEWLPEKLEKQMRSGASVVSCGYIVRQDGEEWTFIHPPVDDWIEHLHFRCMLRAGSTLLARREAVLSIRGFDPELRYYEDWDLALRLAENHPLTVLPEPLVRIHVGTPRSMVAAAPSIRRFLDKHDMALRRIGSTHRRRVCGQHYQNLAAGAFSERRFGRGAKWLLQSFANNPLQNPMRLAALGLAPVDALFGTALIEKAAEGVRRTTQGNDPRPAP